ncbi:ribosomal protein L22/L17 [Phlyctochytrium arcticum]|nr:ribosomal protein L22/L17 [Phlyctochytrium arcticum]
MATGIYKRILAPGGNLGGTGPLRCLSALSKPTLLRPTVRRNTTITTEATASSLFESAKQDAQKRAIGPSPPGDSATPTNLSAPKTLKPIPTFSTAKLRVSHRKLNHLSRLISGMSLEEAHVQMKMSKKRPADRVRALLNRAKAALEHNYCRDPTKYVIEQAWVGKGTYLKRMKIHGRGRFGIMHRPASHLKIILAERPRPQTKEDKDFAQLVKSFRKHSLYVPLPDTQPIRFSHPPWSTKPWKYVSSKKWLSPKNALAKTR